MIAMQYVFTLPADYDMGIIRRRIADKGHFTDNLPGLVFKAYLHADTAAGELAATDNRYAPFYLWHSVEGMNSFLCGPGFQALTASFGWPVVNTWQVWRHIEQGDLAEATYATIERLPIREHTALDELQTDESERAGHIAALPGALAAVSGFEPTTWTLVRMALWRGLPPADLMGCSYHVGHISHGGD